MAPDSKDFHKNIKPLSDSLSVLLKKPSSFFQLELTAARTNKNRFLLVARDLSYTDYMRIKSFPLFKLGIYKVTHNRRFRGRKILYSHPVLLGQIFICLF
jgi:cell division protein FtsI (penicillin-binding protein 3)